MRPVRLALVGFGKWGRNYVKAAHDSGEAEVTHVVLRDDSPSRGAAEKAGIAAVSRLDGLGIDAVVIAIHPRLAPWVAQAAMRQGFPVMIEKPATLSVVEAHALVRAEAETGRTVLVAHQHLFAKGYEELRGMGAPESATAFFTGPTSHDFSATWDYGAHAVACLLGLGALGRNWKAGVDETRRASVTAWHGGVSFAYNGYSETDPPLTRAVLAFARAVRNGGTDDYRFGAEWAVDVAKALEAAS